MKIALMGAGAMGAMVGGRLAKAGNEVWFVDVWEDHVRKMQSDGLVLDTSSGRDVIKVNATTKAAEVFEKAGYMELVIVFVKSLHTEQAIQDAKVFIGDKTYVLSLQNGVGNGDILAKYVPPERVIAGTTLAAAVLVDKGHVRDTGTNTFTQIMPLSGGLTPEIGKLVSVMNAADLDVHATPDVEQAIWDKLIILCCGTSISVITRLSWENICEAPYGEEICREIIKEVCAVGNAKGLKMDWEKSCKHVLDVYSSSKHYPSMLQDAKKKIPTEVDFITGAVIREAEKYNVPVPVNRTVYNLIHMIQKHYDDQMY